MNKRHELIIRQGDIINVSLKAKHQHDCFNFNSEAANSCKGHE